jgi:hypothetical protein
MARHPDWFQRLDGIVETLQASSAESFGRAEIQALFGCAERDSIRLLHKFGASRVADALSLPRPALLAHLEAIRSGGAYTAFLRRRRQVARSLAAARADHAARQVLILGSVDFDRGKSLAGLPAGIQLEPGRIVCEFTHPAEFWSLIDTLADIAAADPAAFERAVAR